MIKTRLYYLIFFIIILFCQAKICLCQEKMITKNSTYSIGTITGKIFNFDRNKNDLVVKVSVNNILTCEQDAFFSEIDSLGCFIISIPLKQTKDVFFAYQGKHIGLILSSDDTIHMEFEASSFPFNLKFDDNKHVNNNEYLYAMRYINKNIDKQYLRYSKTYSDSLLFFQFYRWRDSVYHNEINRFLNFCKSNISDTTVINTILSNLKLYYYSELIRSKSFEKLKEQRLPILLKLIDSIKVNQYDISSSPFMLIVNKVGNYYKYKSFSKVVEMGNVKTSLTSTENIQPKTNIDINEQEVLKTFVALVDQVKNKSLHDCLIAYYLFSKLTEENKNLINENSLNYLSDTLTRNRFLLDLKLNKKNIQNYSLSNNDGDILINNIKSKYNGKVIYIDFWATWCGICLPEIIKCNEIAKHFKNNNVVFVFLCCESDAKNWKNTIKNLSVEGEHILLNSKQYRDLSSTFSISGFPKSIIINRKGDIINTNAPRPSEEGMLITIIDDLLK